MPNAISLATLNELNAQLASGHVTEVYNYLVSQGYTYAQLAQGVNLDNTVSGSTAIEFLGLSGAQTGKPISPAELASIKADLAAAYVGALLLQAQNSSNGIATRDLNADEAWNIHNDVFKEHQLSNDVWTLNTPFSLLSESAREVLWQEILKSDGSVGGDTKAAYALFVAVTKANIDYVNAGNFEKVAEIASWALRIESPQTLGAAAATALKLLTDSATGAWLHYNINSGDINNLQDFINATSDAIAKAVFPDLHLAGPDSDGTAARQAANQYALKAAIDWFFGGDGQHLTILSSPEGAIISGNGKEVIVTVSGTQVTVIDQAGNVQTSLYNAQGVLTKQLVVTGECVSEKTIVNGQVTQQNDYFNDSTSVIHMVNPDHTQSATAYDAAGTALSRTLFDANGNKTTQYIFRLDGTTSQQYDFKLDNSYTVHQFNIDGSQTAVLYGPDGQLAEYASFNANGFKTQDIFYGANGNKTQQYDFNLDKSYVWHVFVADGSQTATLYGANGQIIEYASFNAYGFETQDIFYGANGKKTQQYDFSLDGSYVRHDFNTDGSQTASVIGANGKLTEYAAFNASGFKTQDIFYGANGNKTQQYDFSLDNSYVWHMFNTDGSQTAALYGANGQIIEYASFNAYGFETQDIFYGANGTKTQQYDFSLDGSYVRHDFNLDGSQTASVVGANGKLTEYATFNPYGFKTQDIFYGANGSKTQQYDFKMDGSFTSYKFNSDNSQSVVLFGTNGQAIEYASFNASGFKTQDIFYGVDGNATKIIDFNPAGGYTSHIFNPDGSQIAALFGANGVLTEYASFDGSGFKTQDIFYTNGIMKQLYDFSLDGSYTSHTFNGGVELVGLFGSNNLLHDYYQFSGGKLFERDFFDSLGREIEADRYSTSNGQLTGFTQYQYNADRSYVARDYDSGGHLIAQSAYSGDGQWLKNDSVYIPGSGGSFPVLNWSSSGQF